LVNNSRYNTDLKAVNYTQFLGFGKVCYKIFTLMSYSGLSKRIY
jgi:hypothetical protein